MPRNEKLPSQAGGEVRPESRAIPFSQLFNRLPEMANHLGGDRLMLILVAAILAAGVVLHASAVDLAIIEAPIFAAWLIGKVFKWF